jgi:hypothetical protein
MVTDRHPQTPHPHGTPGLVGRMVGDKHFETPPSHSSAQATWLVGISISNASTLVARRVKARPSRMMGMETRVAEVSRGDWGWAQGD